MPLVLVITSTSTALHFAVPEGKWFDEHPFDAWEHACLQSGFYERFFGIAEEICKYFCIFLKICMCVLQKERICKQLSC